MATKARLPEVESGNAAETVCVCWCLAAARGVVYKQRGYASFYAKKILQLTMAQTGAFTIDNILNSRTVHKKPQLASPPSVLVSSTLRASLAPQYPYMPLLWQQAYPQFSLWAATAALAQDSWRRSNAAASDPGDTAKSQSEGYSSFDEEEEQSSPDSPEIRSDQDTIATAAVAAAGGAQIKKTKTVFSKKKRTTFSTVQLERLECRFNEQKYLTKLDRSLLADAVGLTEKHIKTWYQNRRTKWKKDCSEQDWSQAKERAATQMYTQYLQNKPKQMCS